MSGQDSMGATAADLRFHVSRPVQWFDRDEQIVPQGTTLLTGRPKIWQKSAVRASRR